MSTKMKMNQYTKPLRFGTRLTYRLITKPKNNDTGRWIREELTSLGPTYVKIGQVLSTRPDILPHYITDEISQLQNNVEHTSFTLIEDMLQREYHGKTYDFFDEIDHIPIASASIGQVHLGVLKSNNKKVVIKVQKPFVEDMIREEIRSVEHLLSLFSVFNNKKINDTLMILNDLCKNIEIELDYRVEKNNMLLFQSFFEDSDIVVVPRVFTKLTTKRVIVMEYLPGVKIDAIDSQEGKNMSIHLMNAFISCLLKHGYLHADPHPGNISISEDNKIILYDYGIVARYDIDIKNALTNIFMSFLSKDADVVIENLLKTNIIYIKNNESASTLNDLTKFEYIVLFRLTKYLFDYSENLDIGQFESSIRNDEFIDVNNLPFVINNEMLLLFKTFTTLEGVCKMINNDFNYYIIMNDIMQEFMDIQFMSKKMIQDIEQLFSFFNINMSQNPKKSKRYDKSLDFARADVENTKRHNLLMFLAICSSLLNIMSLL